MSANDSEFKRIYDKLEMIDTNMNNGFSKIEKDIEKLEKQGSQQAERNIRLETLFNSHMEEYKNFKEQNESVHKTWFDKCRNIEDVVCKNITDKIIPEQIKNSQSGIFLKIIGVVFGIVVTVVGIGLTILGMILK